MRFSKHHSHIISNEYVLVYFSRLIWQRLHKWLAAISLPKNGNPSNNKHKIENGLYITRVLLKALVLTHQKSFNPIYFGEPMFTIFSSKFLKYICGMTYCYFRCPFFLFLIGLEILFPYLKEPFINSWKKYINIYLQSEIYIYITYLYICMISHWC